MTKGLYRGKIKGQQTGHFELDWAFGNRVDELSTGKVFICDLSHFDDKTLLKDVLIEVDPSTVGQHTGLTDKNGKKIFEGDILKDADTQKVKSVEYHGNSFVLVDSNRFFYSAYHSDDYEVVGNVHDNPELLGDTP